MQRRGKDASIKIEEGYGSKRGVFPMMMMMMTTMIMMINNNSDYRLIVLNRMIFSE
jgi:hypothetical protein